MLISIISLKVAINGWLHQYFESVVSMYEDRFELYVLCRKVSEKPVDNQAEKTNWWRLALGKPSTATLMEYVHISPFSLPVRRTKELRALTGWYSRPLLCSLFHENSLKYLYATWIKTWIILKDNIALSLYRRRYYFSLFLELSDIAMPFLRAVVTKVSAAVSYFWVSMIGRTLGLIFSGIRQSLGWR